MCTTARVQTETVRPTVGPDNVITDVTFEIKFKLQ